MRVTVKAGPHNIGVTFVKEGSSLIETARQPTRISLQRPATSAYGARHRPGFGDRTLCAERRRGHAEPPPVVCMPASRTRQSTGRKVRRRRFSRR